MTETSGGPRDARSARGILGNHVETDKRVLERSRSSLGFRGSPTLVAASTQDWGAWESAARLCPSRAIAQSGKDSSLDIGKCIMCGICQDAAPGEFRMDSGFALPVKRRSDLLLEATVYAGPPASGESAEEIGERLRGKVNGVLGRSLAIREVDAGSCNGCEVEVTALSNPIYDIERFGVQFVASPRHADLLLVTGVSSRNLELALQRTYEATPGPKVVVAVGACACSGGIFGDTYASGGGIGRVLPVDVYVPGCPPRPEAILYGILLAVDRLQDRADGRRAR